MARLVHLTAGAPPRAAERFDLVQVLRALAALAVVLYHAAGATTKYSTSAAPSFALWGTYGNFGVDLFFVISGFVIFHTTRGLTASQFAAKRLRRIVPIYWVLTLLAFATAATVGLSGRSASLGHLAASMGFVSFSLGSWPLLYVGWSLEYEMYFYAVVALSLLATRNPWPAAVTFLCAGIAGGAIFGAASPVSTFVTRPIMLEFVAGVLIGQLYAGRLGRIEAAAFVAAVAAVLACTSGTALLPLAPAAGLVAAAVFFNRAAPRALTKLGDASYSIYLVQVFTVPGVAKVFRVLLPSHHPELLVVAATLVTMVAGVLCFLLVERPLSRLRFGQSSTLVGS